MPWFVCAGRGPVLVPDYMDDTVARLRGEGWAEVPDPRVVADVAPDPAALVDADPAQTAARRDEQQVAEVKRVKARNAAARKWIEGKA